MLVGLVAAGLTLYPLLVSSIFSTFQKMGASISGTDAVSPSLILDRGILLASAILGAGITSGWAILGIGSLFSVGAALVILLAFALVAARLLEVLLKGYILVGAGIVVGVGAVSAFGTNRLPLIWQNGVVSQLPLPAGQTLGDANSVNASGVAVGSVTGGSQQIHVQESAI